MTIANIIRISSSQRNVLSGEQEEGVLKPKTFLRSKKAEQGVDFYLRSKTYAETHGIQLFHESIFKQDYPVQLDGFSCHRYTVLEKKARFENVCYVHPKNQDTSFLLTCRKLDDIVFAEDVSGNWRNLQFFTNEHQARTFLLEELRKRRLRNLVTGG